MIGKILSFFLIFLMLVIPASASFSEVAIAPDKAPRSAPDMYGNIIVWSEYKTDNNDIFFYNFATKVMLRTTNTSNQFEPRIWNDRVVWVDYRDGGSNIYLQNLTSKIQTKITSNGRSYSPDIYGDNIVYTYSPGYLDPDLYIYNIKTKLTTKVTGMSQAFTPRIYKNIVVWREGYYDDSNVLYAYNITTKEWIKIAEYGNIPDVYENKVVWRDTRTGYSDIYLYDLTTRKETRITSNVSEKQNPTIYGNSVIWQDYRNGNHDLYAYDLKTHQQIHTSGENRVYPAIYDNKVVYLKTDPEFNGFSVYLGTINYLPVAAFTAKQTTTRTIQFIDQSKDMYYWTWNFGDGTTSSIQNPLHKYSKIGTYSVKLTVKNAAGSNSITKSIAVK